MANPTLYSFADVVGSITNPVIPVPFIFSGQIGVGHFTVGYTTVRSQMDVSADGAVMISSILGNNGHFSVEAQQTSSVHAFLFDLFNLLTTAQQLGDVSNWAATQVVINAIVNKTTHILTGVCFEKPPDTPYGSQGARITWPLLAANVATIVTSAT